MSLQWKKNHVFLNFVEMYVSLKVKKQGNVIIIIIIEYAWMCLYKRYSE